MKARQIVEEMDSYVPGKSQDEIAADYGVRKEDIIKLGSNENPWGPSPKAMQAIKEEIKSITIWIWQTLCPNAEPAFADYTER